MRFHVSSVGDLVDETMYGRAELVENSTRIKKMHTTRTEEAWTLGREKSAIEEIEKKSLCCVSLSCWIFEPESDSRNHFDDSHSMLEGNGSSLIAIHRGSVGILSLWYLNSHQLEFFFRLIQMNEIYIFSINSDFNWKFSSDRNVSFCWKNEYFNFDWELLHAIDAKRKLRSHSHLPTDKRSNRKFVLIQSSLWLPSWPKSSACKLK